MSTASGRSLARPRRLPHDVTIDNPATAAWLLAVPCAVVTALVVLVLGPPLGRALYPAHSPYTFWHPEELTPHPTEQARFLLSLGGPILLSAAVLAMTRRAPRLPAWAVSASVWVTQALLATLVVLCVLGQHRPLDRVYFTLRTYVAAAVIAGAIAAVCRLPRARALIVRWSRDSTARRLGYAAAAAGLTLIWMLHAVNSDRSIGWSADVMVYHTAFHLDETFAVINGLTPLVNFTAQYGNLWPYLAAGVLLVFGKTLLVFSITMCSITTVALLSVYGVFRRLCRSPLFALLLFVPFLATTLFHVRGTLDDRFTFGGYFAMFPMRFAGPFFVAWLTTRHLAGPTGRRSWPIFAVAGLAVLNNTDFGVAALGATAAALIWTARSAGFLGSLARIAREAATGIGIALAVMSAITLLRAGSLPHLDQLTEFARIYGLAGFSAIAIPRVISLPLVIYATHVAAIATATVLRRREEQDRALTGMLAWSGIFGLGSAVYYVTRAHPDVMPYLFSPWALTVCLLTVVVARQLAGGGLRDNAVPALAVLMAMGVLACSIAQTPLPWQQIARIHGTALLASQPSPLVPETDPRVRTFVSSLADGPRRFATRPGAPVALLAITGHRIADAYGISDVDPYTGYDSIQDAQQLDRVIAALRKAGGNTLLLPRMDNAPFLRALMAHGFRLVTTHGLRPWPADGQYPATFERMGGVQVGGLIKWVDTHNLHPRALE